MRKQKTVASVLIFFALGLASFVSLAVDAESSPAQADILTQPESLQTADESSQRGVAAPEQKAVKRLGVSIEEIVVTAQKREENINTVPIAISAFTGEDLEALGMNDTRDLGNIVPGFTASESGFNTPVYTLRGVGFNDTTYTATATVGVYVDEVNLPYSIMTKGASLDLERVEVLKGPQGILYGRNTTGGAINYIAKKPTDDFESGIHGTLGRFGTTELEGFISGPLTETLTGRIALKDVRSQEGSQYSNTRPDDSLGKQDKQSFRGTLAWDPSDDLTFRLVLDAWNDESEPRAPQAIFIAEQNTLDPLGVFIPRQAVNYPFVPQHGADPQVGDWNPDGDWQLHDRFVLGALRTDWSMSDRITLTGLLSSMRMSSTKSSIPQSGYNFSNADQVITAHINTSALELRLSGLLGEDDDFDWMLGTNIAADRAFEYHLQLTDMVSALFPDPVTGRSTLGNRSSFEGRPKTDQIAGFFNLGWKFFDEFKLTAGGRYTKTDENFTGCTKESPDSVSTVPGVSITTLFLGLSAAQAAQYTATTGMPGSPDLIINKGDCFSLKANGSTDPFDQDLNEENFSYRLALDWQPGDGYLFYLSAGRGYKAGGFPVLAASQQSQYTPVKQERLQALEIGSKTTFFERQLHADLAIYSYDYKDKQLLTKTLDAVFGPLPILRNAPESKVYGAELNLQFTPAAIEGLFLAATGSYVHTEIERFVGLNSQGQTQDFAGRPFNFAPRLQYTFVANYTWQATDNLNLNVGGDYYRSSDTNSTLEQDPRFSHDSYGFLGARVGVSSTDHRWSVTAFGRNITNEFSTLSIFQNGDALSRLAGPSITWGLTMSYDWF